MCGIAGIVGTREAAVDAARLDRMRETMAHRGPDGAGTWTDPAGRTGLAHRRLAIVDLSPAGAQPMATEDGRYVLVYNGEIYNHAAIRRELESLGHRFRGRSDTEVLLRGYAEWDERVLGRLIGMFAFAIWDRTRGELFAARDRIGIKPLYFCRTGGEFLFASEIKALLADPGVPREMEPIAAWHYLTYIVPPAPLTMFRGIYKLPAGHHLRIRPGGDPEIRRFWDPADATPPDVDPAIYEDDDACSGEVLRRLDRSIERRMMSDVPFGVFLSGGVDSSTNVALMARHMTRPVDTFSVGFDGHPDYNELDWARLVAKRFATNHHEVVIGEREMLDYLPSLIHEQDEPIADWVCVPLHFVSRLARDSGVVVVQVGEGSDELFCGYEHFRDPIAVERRYGRPLRAVPAPVARGLVWTASALGSVLPRWRRRAEVASRILDGEEIFQGGAICWRDDEKESIWRAERPTPDFPAFVPREYAAWDSTAVAGEIVGRFRRENPSADFYQGMLYLELRLRLPELLLMRVDKISMATSVEARVPFLDHELVEFCMDLPMKQRLRNGTGKWILKRAVRGLIPDDVIDRRKMGFGAPVREWLRGPFGEWAADRLAKSSLDLFDAGSVRALVAEHRAGTRDRSFPLWVLLNLSLWHDHWIAGRS